MNPMRAVTPDEKRQVLDQIYEAWCKCPDLRLGQMIANALHKELTRPGMGVPFVLLTDLHGTEDKRLALLCSKLVEDMKL